MGVRDLIKKIAYSALDMVGPPLPVVPAKDLIFYANQFAELPAMDTALSSGSQLAWFNFANTIRSYGAAGKLSHFMRWPVIQTTMFVSWAAWLQPELRLLQSLPDWKSRWHPAIRETTLGSPVRYFNLLDSSGPAIHHGYAISLIEKYLRVSPQEIGFVLEFGGGYGGFARVFYGLQFCGLYAVFDFPHLSLLQQFYLGSLGIARTSLDAQTGATFLNDAAEVRQLPPAGTKSLFVATWSLSEAPLAIRQPFEEILPRFDYIYIAFQHKFEEIDNLRYFQTIASTMQEHEILFHRLSHMTECSVLMARRRNS